MRELPGCRALGTAIRAVRQRRGDGAQRGQVPGWGPRAPGASAAALGRAGSGHYIPKQEDFSGRGPAASPAGIWVEERGTSGAGLRRGGRHPIPPLRVIPRLFPHPIRVSQLRRSGVPSCWGPHLQLRTDPRGLCAAAALAGPRVRHASGLRHRAGHCFPAPGRGLLRRKVPDQETRLRHEEAAHIY